MSDRFSAALAIQDLPLIVRPRLVLCVLQNPFLESLPDTPVRVAYIAPRATKTSLNDDRVNALNTELGNRSDAPELVADQIIAMLRDNSVLQYLGWPEKLFVRINALLPSLVGSALTKNLGKIKHYARR